jgi:hypothetical protein
MSQPTAQPDTRGRQSADPLALHTVGQILATGHAFEQKLRRGHYHIATDVPACPRLRTAFDDLATTT